MVKQEQHEGNQSAPWVRGTEYLRRFLALESAGGFAIMAAAALGLAVYNSPLRGIYDALLGLDGEIRIGALAVEKPLLLWVNDLWMAVFFFLVSMEIKHEAIDGSLSNRRDLTLPVAAAFGGILAPAVIFVAINLGDAAALGGWAIPTATDIAFALGVLTLLGRRVPAALKALLLTIAVIDDLAAIAIIAALYTANLSWLSLALALVGTAVLIALNRLGVMRVAPYVLVGAALWVFVLKSGVHATLAGVALGFAIPGKAARPGESAPLRPLIQALHPWVAFGILPAFAFVNSGIDVLGLDAGVLLGGVPLGIVLGLFIGKPLGVFLFTWLTVKLKFAALPGGTSWSQILGVAALCGIGFTMSLFIASLAFEAGGSTYAGTERLAIMLGSLGSGVAGYLILRFTGAPPPRAGPDSPSTASS